MSRARARDGHVRNLRDNLKFEINPRLAAWAVLLALLSTIELLLADRKYGLFTGGFGQSQAVDSVAERLVFAIGYVSALGAFLIAAWWLIVKLSRTRQSWPPVFHLYVFAGGGFAAFLALQYQLHSYFSDAMSFALIAKLGGGSLGDALLFAANEIAIGVGGALFGLLTGWLVYRAISKHHPPRAGRDIWRYLGRTAIGLFALTLSIAVAMPSWSADTNNGLNRTLAWRSLVLAANWISDFDGDGYGLVHRMPDRHPFDATRHPLALDIPGNGVDEDGFGGDLVLLPTADAPPSTLVTGNRPHLIMVVMESVRHDVIGKRINGRAVAPNLEALVAQGSLVSPAYSHVGFTTESLKSLFTGSLQPGEDAPSLFRELKQSGYRIGVFSGQPEDFGGISETVGMRASADLFVDGTALRHLRAFSNGAQGSILIDEGHLIESFVKNYPDASLWETPQFLYFNFQSAHFPYHHPGLPATLIDEPLPRSQIHAGNAVALQQTYWNAVAYADRRLGELVDRLKQAGVWNNSLMIVTGDHGEDLFEEGFLGHGHSINQRQYGTFLAISRPGVALSQPVGLSDYRAIILSLLQGRPPAPFSRPVLMMVGDLDAPTQIGMATEKGRITTLRLDTGTACLLESGACENVGRLRGAARTRVDQLLRLWGSARWHAASR